jgi:predicted nucleotidyltransferase
VARDWENWLRNSIGPASATEQEDRDRTEKRIRDAIMADKRLAPNVRVFVKGSYANGTNVRSDSDVDIAVEWKDWSYINKVNEAADLPWARLGVTAEEKGPTSADFGAWVEQALVNAFGSQTVEPGNHAITVTKSSTTLDADVVPCFSLLRYTRPGKPPDKGNRLYPKMGRYVENWPEQHKANGVRKNSDTRKRYKQLVRALKRLENDMIVTGRLTQPVQGYFIESLLYNLPTSTFGYTSYKQTTLELLAKLWNEINDGAHSDWVEVNNMKWLWRDGQSWTPQEASDFAHVAWNYIRNG